MVLFYFVLFGSFSLILLWSFDPILQIIQKPPSEFKYNIIDKYSNKNYEKKREELHERESFKRVDISIIIPAYNEENRCQIMIDSALPFMKKWGSDNNKTYELILVDDGSKDNTLNIALNYYNNNKENFRVIQLLNNVGKGGAIKVGVENSYGDYILFADADGATDIQDFSKLYENILLTQKYVNYSNNSLVSYPIGIVIGSRAHLENKSMATRSLLRTVLMRGFHVIVMLFCTKNIKDTQCGFKLFTNKVAKLLFNNIHLYRWTFDIELIYLAEQLNIPIKEVSVNWREIEGSKLINSKFDIVKTSLTMARDIICIRLAYLSYYWKIPHSFFNNNNNDNKIEL